MVIIINMYTILVQHPLLNMIYTGFGSRFKGRSPEGKNAFFETLLELPLVNIRKSHLRKTYLGGLPEVGLPESISHQKVPPQLLCIICTVFALQDSFESARYSK